MSGGDILPKVGREKLRQVPNIHGRHNNLAGGETVGALVVEGLRRYQNIAVQLLGVCGRRPRVSGLCPEVRSESQRRIRQGNVATGGKSIPSVQ